MKQPNILGVGVIGAGAWGRNHVETFYKLGNLTAVADASSEQLSTCRLKYPGTKFYSNYQDLIADPSVSAVVIASPAHLHAEMACEAMCHGKHVLVEKPMALCTQDAERLIGVAESTGCILMVGHLLLYDPLVLSIQQAVRDQVIGEVRSIHLERCKLGRVRSIENVLWSFGVHDLAVLLHVVNLPCLVTSVTGQSIIQSHIEDDMYVHMALGTRTNAHLHVSWLWPEPRRKTTIIGSQGMIVYDEIDRKLTTYRRGIDANLNAFDNGTVAITPAVSWERLFGDSFSHVDTADEGRDIVTAGALEIECRHFIACIEQNLTPISDGRQGLEVVRLVEDSMRLMLEVDAK